MVKLWLVCNNFHNFVEYMFFVVRNGHYKYELYREKRTEYRADRHTVSGALQTF